VCYEDMNCDTKCRKLGGLWWLWTVKGQQQCISFNGAHNIRHLSSYLASVETMLRFRDIASYLSTVADFYLLHLHLTVEGVTPVEFGGDLWRQKTIESLDYCVALLVRS